MSLSETTQTDRTTPSPAEVGNQVLVQSHYDVSANQWNATIAAIKNQSIDYFVYQNSGLYYTKKGQTGEVDEYADFTTLFNEVPQALNTAGGGRIVIGGGTFPIEAAALHSALEWNSLENVTIDGIAPEYSIIKLADSQPDTILGIGDLSDAVNFRMRNLTIDGNASNQPAWTSDHYQIGFWTARMSNSLIENCVFKDIVTLGLRFISYDAPTEYAYYTTIRNNKFVNTRIGFSSTNSCKILNNTFDGGDGITAPIEINSGGELGCANDLIKGNTFINLPLGSDYAIMLGMTGTTNVTGIRNNIVSNNHIIGLNNGCSGIRLAGCSYGNQILNNTITNMEYGIELTTLVETGGTTNKAANTIANNRLETCGYGIVGTSSKRQIIENNTIVDTYHAPISLNKCSYWRIANNTLIDWALSTSSYAGVGLSGAAGVNSDYNDIYGNTFIVGTSYTSGTYGVRVYAGTTNLIRNNRFEGAYSDYAHRVKDDGGDAQIRGNEGYIARGESRTFTGTITTLTENAYNSLDNPFGQTVRLLNLDVYVSTGATATTPNIDCGIGNSATADYTTLFDDLPGETTGFYRSTITTPGTQTVPQLWASGSGNRYLNLSIKDAAATGMVATYTATVMGV